MKVYSAVYYADFPEDNLAFIIAANSTDEVFDVLRKDSYVEVDPAYVRPIDSLTTNVDKPQIVAALLD